MTCPWAGQPVKGGVSGKPAPAERQSADQVVAEGAGGPLAKLHAALGIDPVTDGDDRIQVVVRQGSPDLTAALGSNYRGILGRCLPLELLGSEDVSQMQADVVGRGLEKVSHLPLGQPDGISVEADINARLAALGLVDDDLAAGGCCRRYGAHGIGGCAVCACTIPPHPAAALSSAAQTRCSRGRLGWNPCRFCTGCPGDPLKALRVNWIISLAARSL